MNKVLSLIAPVMLFGASFKTPMPSPAQKTVAWGYSCNKLDIKSPKDAYEVRIRAKVDEPWHIFSQDSKGIGQATKFTLNKNPLLKYKDHLAEKGEMKTEQSEYADGPEKFYEDEVVFVDTVYVPRNVKTNFVGSVSYMTCKEGQCLSPTSENFDIKLENGWKLNW